MENFAYQFKWKVFNHFIIGSNKGVSSRFCADSQVRHETPEEGQRTYQPKHCDYNNKVWIIVLLIIFWILWNDKTFIVLKIIFTVS